jgi:hypothetical protein
MYKRGYALILDGEDASLGALALSLIRMGVDVLYANDRHEALLLCGQKEAARVRALLFPEDHDLGGLRSVRARLQARRGRPRLGMVAVGVLDEPERCAALAKEGAEWVLRPPYDGSLLRWVVNVAMTPDERHGRIHTRVPTSLLARGKIDFREKEMLVGNLSVGGAFVETQLPSRLGTRITLQIPLPSGEIVAAGLVSYRREPGDPEGLSQSPGMGVAFEPLEPHALALLSEYVTLTARHFTL